MVPHSAVSAVLVIPLLSLAPTSHATNPWGPMQTQTFSECLTPKEAANFLRLSPKTLANMRCRGDGPVFIKAGRAVLYTKVDLAAYIAANRHSSTMTGASS